MVGEKDDGKKPVRSKPSLLEVQGAQTTHVSVKYKEGWGFVSHAPVRQKIRCRGDGLARMAHRLNQPRQRSAHRHVFDGEKYCAGISHDFWT